MMIDDLTGSLYPGLFPDLVGGSLLQMAAGERLWKLYFLRPAWGRDERVEHRIYTKEEAGGAITLVSYTFRMPRGSRPIKQNLAIAREIAKDTLNQVIWNVVRSTQIGPDELEVIDLSRFATFEEQVHFLRGVSAGARNGVHDDDPDA
jgi:hypothetical protein